MLRTHDFPIKIIIEYIYVSFIGLSQDSFKRPIENTVEAHRLQQIEKI